jgi:hypothetical protein
MKYNIYHDGETQGPFTRGELEAKNLPPDTPCAAEGETAWGTVGAVMDQLEPQPTQLEHTAVGALAGGVMMALWMVSLLVTSVSVKTLLVIGSVGVLALGVLAILRIRKSETSTGISLLAIGMALAGMALVASLLVKLDGGKKSSSSSSSSDRAKKEGRIGDLLGIGKARAMASRTTCFSNQMGIRASTQNWALDKKKGDSSAPTMEDLLGYFNGGEMPECPAGGEYDLKTVAEYPSCSEHGCYIEEEACTYCGNHFPASNIRFHVRKCPKNNTTQKMPPASGKTTIIK